MRRREFLGGLAAPALYAGGEVRIVYSGGVNLEAVAAQELARYVREMTGAVPRLMDERGGEEAGGATVKMFVGRTRAAARLLSSGDLEDPARLSAEAYIVRSLGGSVVFLGGSPLATLYAVYHYLERHCGAGFFWDGDHVPRLAALPVTGVDLSARPHFRDRFYMNGCIHVYTSPWWHWEDWRPYIDWMVKSRYNILDLSYSPGYNQLWQQVWRKFGVEVAPETWSVPPFDLHTAFGVEPTKSPGWREGRAALHKQIVEYARARGLRIVGPSLPGVVPPEFRKIFPKEKVLSTTWADFPPRYYLHPLSRMYRDVGKAFLEAYVAEFGTDHIYTLENYGELNVNESEAVRREMRNEIVMANFRVMSEVDPQGTGLVSGWTFLASEWTPEMIRAQVQRLPANRARIQDIYTEQHPLYKETEFFFGLLWHFGILHAFGGETHLHGNLPLLEKQARSVAADPRASQCVGFMLMTEVSGHNHFYYSFVNKLGWNPGEVDLAAHTREYARTRYGQQAAGPMQKALEELLASVLSADEFAKPMYWRRLLPRTRMINNRGPEFIPCLARALRHALEAADSARGNPLYLHDLNDIARQYLAERFNLGVMRLLTAYMRIEEETFRKEAAQLREILTRIEDLLGADDYYWLSPLIRKARSLPGAPLDVDARARNILTVWGWGESLRDYACRDYYELVKWYYRPRVDAFIEELELRLRLGQRELGHGPGDERLGRAYSAIEREFVVKGFPLIGRKPEPEKVIELSRGTL